MGLWSQPATDGQGAWGGWRWGRYQVEGGLGYFSACTTVVLTSDILCLVTWIISYLLLWDSYRKAYHLKTTDIYYLTQFLRVRYPGTA